MTSEIDRDDKERELYQTLEQERILLKHLFSQLLTARKFYSKVKEELFSSPQRLWLFRTAKQIFKDTGALFNEKVVLSELDRIKKISVEIWYEHKREIKEVSHKQAISEWNMITGSELAHTPEWLIEDLEKKMRARQFMHVTEVAVDKVLKGESDSAIHELNSDLIRIRSNNSKSKPIRRLSDPEWQLASLKEKLENPGLYTCLRTGFPTFDSLAGLYRGELTLLTAHTGVGKSTLMRSMAMGAAELGLNVLFIVNEEIEDQAGNKFAAMRTQSGGPDDIKYGHLKQANKDFFSEETLERFASALRSFGETCGEIFILELPQFHTCADIEQAMVELQQKGERLDIVFLDYLDHLKPMEKCWSEVDEQNKAIAEFKSVCMQFRVAGMTATQADTASVDAEDMSAYNVRGSKQKSGAANIVLAIKELPPCDASGDKKTTDMVDAVTWKIMITKNRDGAKISFYCRFHKASGTVRESSTLNKEDQCAVERDKAGMEKIGGSKKKGGKSPSDFKKDKSKEKPSEEKEEEVAKEEEENSENISSLIKDQDDFDDETANKLREKQQINKPVIIESEDSISPKVENGKIIRKAKG